MRSFLLWTGSQLGRSETRHFAADLDELRELILVRLHGRVLYLEARGDSSETLDLKVRSSADDLTEDDFLWLTDAAAKEHRGIRA